MKQALTWDTVSLVFCYLCLFIILDLLQILKFKNINESVNRKNNNWESKNG